VDVATLYVRNLPADLYDDLRQWAEDDDRSVNAEVIELLRRERERRREESGAARRLAAYFERYADEPIPVPDLVELIHEGRDRDWFRDYGI
jgi:hypothetical protein